MIVFQRTPKPDQAILFEKFKNFIKSLQYNTELRVILIFHPKDFEMVEAKWQDKSVPIIKLENLARSDAIEWLKRVIYVSGKSGFVRGDKIERHKIIDVWERHNFDDDLAFSISKKLSEKMKLLNIAEEMESRLMLNQGGIMTERLVSQDTTISTLSVVS